MPVQLGIDPRSLDSLAAQAKSGRSTQTLQKVARQFEAVFADMMIHSMRATHLGSDLAGRGGPLYTSLYDWQIAEDMTRGRGLGIASMLMRQLQGNASSGSSTHPALHAIDAADHFTGPDPSAPAAPPDAGAPAAGPAATAPQGSATSNPASSLTSDVMGFVERLWPEARSVARQLGVSARAVIAQAALETGWGRHESAPNNLFGIKASGSQPGVEQATTEYAAGVATPTTAKFRRFPSDNAAMASYATLIRTDPRYQAVLGSGDDVQRFASALQQAGYATDPAYAQKLVAVANDPRLVTALNAVAGTQME